MRPLPMICMAMCMMARASFTPIRRTKDHPLRTKKSEGKFVIRAPPPPPRLEKQIDGKLAAPPPGQSSLTATVVNLAKTIIGGGMLALPAGLAARGGTGYGAATLLLLLSAITSAFTFILVGRTVERTQAASFREAWSRSISSGSAWLVDYSITLLAFGMCLIYACFLGDTLTPIFQAGGISLDRQSTIVAVTTLGLLPLTLLKDLSALRYSSYVGIGAVIYTVAFIVWRYFDGSYNRGGHFWHLVGQPLGKTSTPWLQVSTGTAILFSMFSTSFMAHTNAVKFYNELEERSVPRFTKASAIAMGSAAFLYLTVMILGFETFGSSSLQLVLNNYHVSKDDWATFARIATGISIVGAHPLLFAGLRDSFLSLLPSKVSERSDTWLISTFVLLSSATAISLVCKDLTQIVSLLGSSLGSAIVFIYPALMYSSLLRKFPEISKTKAEMPLLYATMAFGTLVGIGGTYLTLKG